MERAIVSGRLSGPNPYEIFVEDIIGLCKGKRTGFNLKDIEKIFKPQWEYQRLAKKQEVIMEAQDVQKFLDEGTAGMHYNAK